MVARSPPEAPESWKKENFSSSKSSNKRLVLTLIGSDLFTCPPLDLEMVTERRTICWVFLTHVHHTDIFQDPQLHFTFLRYTLPPPGDSQLYLQLFYILPLAFVII